MNKILRILALLLMPFAVFSQARLVINGTSTVTVVENGGISTTPIYIEIANSANNAISTKGQNGWIVSESEYNMVKWDIGTATGTDSVPFGYNALFKLPLVVNIGSSGVLNSGAGSLLFSTYHTPGSVSASKPTGVTNMASATGYGNPFPSDNSNNVVNRFWIIDAGATGFAYTTKPVASSIKFSYINTGTYAEFASPHVTANQSKLVAQRWNPSHGWGDWLGSGTQNSAGNVGTVTNTNSVSAVNFFRAWALAPSNVPLPIDLSSFTAQCDNDSALIQWTSQSELNNDYYTLEKTADNIHFQTVATLSGAGTSSFAHNYSIIDKSPYPGISYYLLYQTDFDGNRNQAGDPISFEDCGTNTSPVTTINAFNTTNYIEVQINSVAAGNFTIGLTDILGQVLFSRNHSVALGYNEIQLPNSLTAGVYVLTVRNDQINYAKKMVIGVR